MTEKFFEIECESWYSWNPNNSGFYNDSTGKREFTLLTGKYLGREDVPTDTDEYTTESVWVEKYTYDEFGRFIGIKSYYHATNGQVNSSESYTIELNREIFKQKFPDSAVMKDDGSIFYDYKKYRDIDPGKHYRMFPCVIVDNKYFKLAEELKEIDINNIIFLGKRPVDGLKTKILAITKDLDNIVIAEELIPYRHTDRFDPNILYISDKIYEKLLKEKKQTNMFVLDKELKVFIDHNCYQYDMDAYKYVNNKFEWVATFKIDYFDPREIDYEEYFNEEYPVIEDEVKGFKYEKEILSAYEFAKIVENEIEFQPWQTIDTDIIWSINKEK
jgi:hypothetical protein